MIITCIIVIALGGCSRNTNSSNNNPKSENGYLVETLKEEGGTDWGVPNPFLHETRGPGTSKMKLVYGSLLEQDEKGDVSWLAESWSFEGNDYTFTLFDNLTFHDNKPLTTEDVAFTIDYFKENPPVTNSLGAGDKFIVDHYIIVDEKTITITVKEANADTLRNLGSFVIIPKHVWEKVEDPYSYKGDGYLIGSGAYMCTEYSGASGTYEFTAYEGWVNGKQSTEKIQFPKKLRQTVVQNPQTSPKTQLMRLSGG